MRRRSAGVSSAAGTSSMITSPCEALHDVERRADDRLVVAHREHLRARARRCPASARSSRASRRTSCALGGSGGRGGRRSTTSRAAAARQVGDVRVAVADRLGRDRRPRRARARRGTRASGSSTSSGTRSLRCGLRARSRRCRPGRCATASHGNLVASVNACRAGSQRHRNLRGAERFCGSSPRSVHVPNRATHPRCSARSSPLPRLARRRRRASPTSR